MAKPIDVPEEFVAVPHEYCSWLYRGYPVIMHRTFEPGGEAWRIGLKTSIIFDTALDVKAWIDDDIDTDLHLSPAQKIERATQQTFDKARQNAAGGTIEELEDRCECLERAVAHLYGYLVERFELTTAECNKEAGLSDF